MRTNPSGPTRVAPAVALLGAMVWVANLFVDSTALAVGGTALLGLAVLVVGSRLADRPWLAVVTALGSLALAWSLLAVLRQGYDDRVLEAVLGAAAGLIVAIVVARSPGGLRTPGAVVRPGNHRG